MHVPLLDTTTIATLTDNNTPAAGNGPGTGTARANFDVLVILGVPWFSDCPHHVRRERHSLVDANGLVNGSRRAMRIGRPTWGLDVMQTGGVYKTTPINRTWLWNMLDECFVELHLLPEHTIRNQRHSLRKSQSRHSFQPDKETEGARF
jgi:hypothetical protein